MVSDAEKRRVGALIRARRQQLGLHQPEFADRVGVSRNAVSSWETGRSYPSRKIGKIEAVLAPFSVEELPEIHPDMADPAEALIWTRATKYSPGERRVLLMEYRAMKRASVLHVANGTG